MLFSLSGQFERNHFMGGIYHGGDWFSFPRSFPSPWETVFTHLSCSPVVNLKLLNFAFDEYPFSEFTVGEGKNREDSHTS